MNLPLDRQSIGTVLLCALIVLAGCSGSGSNQTETVDGEVGAETTEAPATPTSTATSTPTETEVATEASTAAATTTQTSTSGGTETETAVGTSTPTGPAPTLGGYTFSEGESYVYELVGQRSNGTTAWNVTDVSGDQLTVEVSLSTPDQNQSATFTGTGSGIYRNASNSYLGVYYLSLRTLDVVTEGRSLEVGNSWTFRAGQIEENLNAQIQFDTAEVEVTGTDSYSGVECTTLAVTSDNGANYSVCVNPDYPFVIHLSSPSGGGITLAESSR